MCWQWNSKTNQVFLPHTAIFTEKFVSSMWITHACQINVPAIRALISHWHFSLSGSIARKIHYKLCLLVYLTIGVQGCCKVRNTLESGGAGGGSRPAGARGCPPQKLIFLSKRVLLWHISCPTIYSEKILAREYCVPTISYSVMT